MEQDIARAASSVGLAPWVPRRSWDSAPGQGRRLAEVQAPLAGRQREVALLMAHLAAAANGRASVALAAGEPGIGKTRLLQEVADRAERQGMLVLRGAAAPAEGMPPYLAVLEAAHRHIRTAALDELREQIRFAPASLATIFPDLVERLGELPPGPPVPPEQARLRLYEAVSEFLAALATSRPVVLLLDDLQWADAATLDLLRYITRRQTRCRLLILGAYREGEVDYSPPLAGALADLNRRRMVTILPISPLSVADIEQLAAHYLNEPVSPAFSRILHAQSEGNPFFAEELLLAWSAAGILSETSPPEQLLRRLAHRLPSGILAVIRERVQRLTPATAQLLEAAAVIGRRFTSSVLATLTGQELEVVEAQLTEAMLARLIAPYRAQTLTFSHDNIREYFYEGIQPSRRRRLHQQIGEILEARTDAEPARHLASLAFHFARCEDRERGVHYASRAAEAALRASAPIEAMHHYQTALRLLDPADYRRRELLMRLGHAALLAGRESVALAAFNDVRDQWARTGAARLEAQATYGMAQAYWRRGALPAARAALESALALLDERITPEAVRVLVDLATLVGTVLDRQVDGLVYAHRALESARRLRDPSLEAAASRTAGSLLVRENDHANGVALLEQALDRAKAADNCPEAMACCASLAQAYVWSAAFAASDTVTREREEFAEQIYDVYHLRYVYTWRAFLHTCRGEWSEAERSIARARQFVDTSVTGEPLGFLRQITGFLAYQRGDYVTAARECGAAVAIFRNQNRDELSLCLGIHGLALLAAGQVGQARGCLVELEELIKSWAAGNLLAVGGPATGTMMGCLALLALRLGDNARVSRYYPALLDFQGQHHWFLVDHLLGLIETRHGHWSAAAAHLAQAEATARRERLQPQLARTLVAQAELALARGGAGGVGQARGRLGEAIDQFAELGVEVELTAAREQLRALPSQPRAMTARTNFSRLTDREMSVLRLLAVGKSNRQIAEELFLSDKTVANHLTSIFGKTGTENRAGAVGFALRHGMA